MTGLDYHSETRDCEDIGADEAARYAFLRAVNSLPHVEQSSVRPLDLSHTVESEIIPRLMLAHRNDHGRRTASAMSDTKPGISAAEIAQFRKLILGDKLDAAVAIVMEIAARGVSVEAIMLDLLAPTASQLGDMWDQDDVDFSTVTIALAQLQQVLRLLSGFGARRENPLKAANPILLSAVPGESHLFSLLLIDQFFRSDGWDVWTMPGASRKELLDLVAKKRFAVVGLSVSCDVLLPELKLAIPALRAASANPSLAIMVGGPIFAGKAGLARELGADGTAHNGVSAVTMARRFVEDGALS